MNDHTTRNSKHDFLKLNIQYLKTHNYIEYLENYKKFMLPPKNEHFSPPKRDIIINEILELIDIDIQNQKEELDDIWNCISSDPSKEKSPW